MTADRTVGHRTTTQRAGTLLGFAMIVTFGGVVGFVALSLLQVISGINAGAFR